ncbi:MAG: hypothetical protein J7M34_00610 [Anaerolineae bacterium]|nr:hypothetical protein [Anaerolineae bacterium]
MNEKIWMLISSIRQDMQTIEQIYEELERHPIHADTSHDELIVVAYHLHNLYNAFENIFQNIASTFENSVDDVSRWHTQLLERMRLNALPIRPAVINEAAYEALDELRRFRHVFQHAYSTKIDPERLQLVLKKAMQLKKIYVSQLEQFIAFLQRLAEDDALSP